MKKIFIYPLIAISLFSCTPKGFENLGNGLYEHTYSGFDFPEKIGEFERTPIQIYDYTGKNVGIGYQIRTPDCNITFTMYVYPANDLSLEEEFKKVEMAIRQYRQNVKLLSEESVYYIQDSLRIKGKEANYKFSQKIKETNIAFFSQADLFKYQSNFIKYRITYPVFHQNCAGEKINELLEKLKWNIK